MDVSENGDTPKSAILIGFSIINHPFWGTPIFGNTQMDPGCHDVGLAEFIDPFILPHLWGRFVSGEGLGFYRQVQQKFNKRNRSFLDTYIIFFGIWNELKNSGGNYTIYLYKAIFFQKVLGTFRKTATTNDLCISFVILQKCLMKRNKNIRT